MSPASPTDSPPIDWAQRVSASLVRVRAGIGAACDRVGRPVAEVRLVAVSKHQPSAAIAAALRAGQCDFGENYAQELRDKQAELSAAPLPASPRWHFIGPLQRNKVNLIVGRVALLHTVDTIALVEALAGRVGRLREAPGGVPQDGLVQDCLVQVNVGDESQKAGCPPEDLPRILDAIAAQNGRLRCLGLMCIPPALEDPEAVRPYFALLRRLREQQAATLRSSVTLHELSMGMSHDYEVAIAEGATLIRVGTALFGPRQPG